MGTTQLFMRSMGLRRVHSRVHRRLHLCSELKITPPQRLVGTDPGCAAYMTFSTVSASAQENKEIKTSNSKIPQRSLQLDFFGEPVTFCSSNSPRILANAAAALDGFLLAAVSKGKSCVGGGDEAGIDVKSAHSVALSWTELLKHASVWNPSTPEPHLSSYAPMMVVTAVAPLLVQTGKAYVRHLDTLLSEAKTGVPGLPKIQLMELSLRVVSFLDHPDVELDDRERLHLEALQDLLGDKLRSALHTYLRLLRTCPGDLLALCLAIDLSQRLGDKDSALRASGSVVAYWNERCGGIVTPALPGHSMATAWIALGFAVAGHHVDAEPMAERAMNQARKISGGVATWAQAHIFDAGGRVAEGISAMSNHDGIVNYEGSGFLFFDCRLGGYGARFSLDREERGRGKSVALRLYDRNFERVLHYSGFSSGSAWQQPMYRAPLAWKQVTALEEGEPDESIDSRSLLEKLFGEKKHIGAPKYEDYEIMLREGYSPSSRVDGWEPSIEDVLTWLPPPHQLVCEATHLLLRFTLNGTISSRNYRWDDVRNAWRALLDLETEHGDGDLSHSPLVSVTGSLLFPPEETGGDRVGNGKLAQALNRMGSQLKLGNPSTVEEKSKAVREVVADRDPKFWLPAEEGAEREWQLIVRDFEAAIYGEQDGSDALLMETWNFDTRPIVEHALCYAACKAGDIGSLSLARAVCSKGVTLRASSPEEWWRYSIVLGLLGDEFGSEDALENSINVGGGQGAR